jgi:hypothetical protein
VARTAAQAPAPAQAQGGGCGGEGEGGRRGRFEMTEVAACCAVVDALRTAGEECLRLMEQLEQLEGVQQAALERQALAAEGDDVAEEDEANKLVAQLAGALQEARLRLSRNGADPELWHELTTQLDGMMP